MSNRDSQRTIKVFVSDFIKQDFFKEVLTTCLYPAEFSIDTYNQGVDTLQFIKKFFTDLNSMCVKLNMTNYNQIKGFISLIKTILTIRENGSTIINYDNVFQHLASIDLAQTQLIQGVISEKLSDIDGFRTNVDNIIRKIQAYYEVCSISGSITTFDQFVEYASDPNVKVFEAIKMFKDNVVQLYSELSKLQSINKYESEKDYFVLGNDANISKLANTLVQYISHGYSFFKTGFEIFDSLLEGFESSSVHIISAPSNHGKSILLVNLCHRIIQNNIEEFDKNDAILFITLEDEYYVPIKSNLNIKTLLIR